MVFGFMIQSLDASKPFTFISYFFTPEGNDEWRKLRQTFIANKVVEEYAFRKEYLYNLLSKLLLTIRKSSLSTPSSVANYGSMKDLLLQDSMYSKGSEEGAFRITPGGETPKKGTFLFESTKFVIWKQILR
jgi:hypothetical protein